MTPPAIKGSSTVRKALPGVAPSVRAASRRPVSRLASIGLTLRTTKGKASTAWMRITLQSGGIQSKGARRKATRTPKPSATDETTIGARASVSNQAVLRSRLCRKP